MIRPCPYCGKQPTQTRLVRVMEGSPFITEDPSDLPETTTETTMCEQYKPCGHAFSRDDLKEVVNALRDLQKLRRELNQTENADRVKELKDYEIPAALNTVKNRRVECDLVEINND